MQNRKDRKDKSVKSKRELEKEIHPLIVLCDLMVGGGEDECLA